MALDPLKAYKIAFKGLSIGGHRFSFDIGPAFFSCFEDSEIAESAVQLELHLEKESNMLVFDFDFGGWVEMMCGRCLGEFKLPVENRQRLYVKFGELYHEESEEVVVIPYTESHFDISHYVYEFLHLLLPMSRVHPDDAPGVPGCDKDMLERMRKHAPPGPGEDGGGKESPFDALKDLRFDDDA